MAVGDILLADPVFSYKSESAPDKEKKQPAAKELKDIYEVLGRFTPDLSLGKLDVSNAVLNSDTASLLLEGLHVNTAGRSFKLKTIRFDTKDLSFPLDNGFYTLHIGKINLDNTDLDLADIHLLSKYPKMEFAYLQPEHKDWFDVRAGRLSLSGIDLPAWIAEKVIRVRKVQVDDAVLQNFKNQQIIVPRRIVPMIYSGLQKAPVKLAIDSLDVNNFSVVYEELARKRDRAGKTILYGDEWEVLRIYEYRYPSESVYPPGCKRQIDGQRILYRYLAITGRLAERPFYPECPHERFRPDRFK